MNSDFLPSPFDLNLPWNVIWNSRRLSTGRLLACRWDPAPQRPSAGRTATAECRELQTRTPEMTTLCNIFQRKKNAAEELLEPAESGKRRGSTTWNSGRAFKPLNTTRQHRTQTVTVTAEKYDLKIYIFVIVAAVLKPSIMVYLWMRPENVFWRMNENLHFSSHTTGRGEKLTF